MTRAVALSVQKFVQSIQQKMGHVDVSKFADLENPGKKEFRTQPNPCLQV